MGKDRATGDWQRVQPEEARAHGNDPDAVRVSGSGRGVTVDAGGQHTDSRAAALGARGYSSDTLRAPGADTVARRGGLRWGAVLVGVLTALTTFLLLELLVWGIGLPVGSDRLDTSHGRGAADWVTAIVGFLAFLVGGYVAGKDSAVRDSRAGLRTGLLAWLLGTALILALSTLGPEILGALFGAPADVMGTGVDGDTDNIAQKARNDALGAFFSLLAWGIASALGGWAGNLIGEPE